ncbi:MAG: hypothetical protein AAF466_01070, partial [Bacteroidota bacterium]
FIPKKNKGAISLEIRDENNRPVVTILADSSQLKTTKVVEDMNLSQTFRYVDTKLSQKPGMHRFNWNMREMGAWADNKRRSYAYGPLVAPGNYVASLKIGDQSFEQSFKILIDPRVDASGVSEGDIKTQVAFQRQVIALLSDARKLESALKKEAKKLKGKKNKAKTARLEQIEGVLKLLKNDDGAYPQQMLLSQISYLLNMVRQADQLPGADAQRRLEVLSQKVSELMQMAADS